MEKLIDNHGRSIEYIRIAVTDRCNLRCYYCMPEEGIEYVPRDHLLHYEEIERLVRVLAEMGVRKVRFTGGEPFIRRDVIHLMESIASIPGIEALHITTNGTVTRPFIPQLKKLGVKGINLSLDTLDPQRFKEITRRDVLQEVMDTLDELVDAGLPVKVNMVVLGGINEDEIGTMARLAETRPVDVRYIEEMPFNGGGHEQQQTWRDHRFIVENLKSTFPDIMPVAAEKSSTALMYAIPGFQGKIGIIPAYSRTFCGSCNRIRLTPEGVLKTCLYDRGMFNIRDIIRSGATDEQIKESIRDAVGHRAKDGFEAERQALQFPLGSRESMSTIGG
ncbi:MAG: GTP 3',8-cyclase MoaA [Saprospiraceae bacterium]|nr:GTP 3',8-cyclase MoaA [Saprospiraceae bacterium]MCB9318591.1 GTP 3',8-cyclase MoaA [Lewinellaceae bacterium]